MAETAESAEFIDWMASPFTAGLGNGLPVDEYEDLIEGRPPNVASSAFTSKSRYRKSLLAVETAYRRASEDPFLSKLIHSPFGPVNRFGEKYARLGKLPPATIIAWRLVIPDQQAISSPASDGKEVADNIRGD